MFLFLTVNFLMEINFVNALSSQSNMLDIFKNTTVDII